MTAVQYSHSMIRKYIIGLSAFAALLIGLLIPIVSRSAGGTLRVGDLYKGQSANLGGVAYAETPVPGPTSTASAGCGGSGAGGCCSSGGSGSSCSG